VPSHLRLGLAGVRVIACALSLTALLALAGTPAAVAARLGSGSAFSELTEEKPEETKTAATVTTGSTTNSEPTNSHTTILLVLGAAVLLLGAIAFLILRDARGVAPASDPQLAEARSARDSAVALRKRRAKAKAARRQRKQNGKRRR
jgi:hypothetical protein